MKKKFLVICLLISCTSFSNNNWTEDSNGFETNDKYEINYDKEDDIDNSDEENELEKKKETLDSNNEEYSEKISEADKKKSSSTAGGFFSLMDKVFDISDTAFTAIDIAGTTASSVLAVIGSIPTIFGTGAPGASSAADTIQSLLLKINQIKTRIDQLKQYKRVLENMKGLDVEDLATVDGINKALNSLNKLLTDIAYLKDQSIDFYSEIKGADLSKGEGWDSLLGLENHIKKVNNNVLDNVAGDTNKKTLEAISDLKNRIKNLKPTTEKGELEKISELMGILISLTEKSISDTAILGANKIIEENKKLDEKIVEQERKKEEILELNNYINNQKKQFNSSILGKKFVGDIYE